ncbi:MAG: tetratricopeptide repeat protein [Acidobacteriota bacterium]|nr:tetratricopeptide repeat protein [Acidobacteriota bacterium]
MPESSPEQRGSADQPPSGSEATISSPGESDAPTLKIGHGHAPGTAIGPYSLVELIGEGGMGEVWLAEQKRPVRRRVAIKLIKAGMDTREVITRFESERQALALMDHPAIAKVFDAGTTPQGRPYFAMEYVVGVPITIYCDKHKLTTRQRLELFIGVCGGVQHAHHKAIIHRDLKPSNILVTEVDGKPMPKIIDFGVAKAVSQPLTAETMPTRVGSVLGTPEYMSPEQADSAGEDIDTRSDVYSLGVILYELLVGALPLDLHKLTFDEVLRKLRYDDTPKPSTKLRTLGERSIVAAQKRQTDRAALTRELRGDLDAITLKAVEKDRSRRYGTPSEFGADIRRYLRSEPVEARGVSFGYRARKYVGRHRAGVAVATILCLLLASFAVAQAFQLRRVARERDRADRITKFMTRMFRVSDPSEAHGNKITAREILDKASKEIHTGLANDPVLQSHMMYIMGTVYESLGLYGRAQALYMNSIDIRRRILGSENIETLRSMYALANSLSRQGRHAEAAALHRQVLEIRRRVLGPEHPDTLLSEQIRGEGLYYKGRYAEAEKSLQETLDKQRRVLGPNHADTLLSMRILAGVFEGEKRYTDAEKLFAETIGLQRRQLGRDDPDTLASMSNMGECLMHLARYTEAENWLREARDGEMRVLGADHPETANTEYNLACVFAHQGRSDEAFSNLREALEHGDSSYVSSLESDPDLQPLRSDPRFGLLVKQGRQRSALMAKTP